MQLLTTRETAAFYRVTMNTVYRWVKRGLIEVVELPGSTERRRSWRFKCEIIARK